jgi:hypothetical protein
MKKQMKMKPLSYEDRIKEAKYQAHKEAWRRGRSEAREMKCRER